ncbi:MAG: ATP-binding cassette domain-containing protein, partial [Pyrobaculum sp.]
EASGDHATMAVELRNVTKIYGNGVARTVALDNVSLSISAGESVVLMGPSGSGKTTLLRAASGVVPYEGSIRIFGAEVRRARRLLGVSSNLPEIYQAVYRVGGIAEVWADLKGDFDPRLFEELLRSFRLDPGELSRKPIHALSAGESTLVRLAAALASRPRAYLVDEPFENVDPARRRLVAEALRSFGEVGLVATHDLGALRAMPEFDAYLLVEGRIYGPFAAGELLDLGLSEGVHGDAVAVLEIGGVKYSLRRGAGRRLGDMATIDMIYSA